MESSNLNILCIVKNDSKVPGEGLRNAFNKRTNAFINKFFYKNSNSFSNEFGNCSNNKFLLITSDSVIPLSTIDDKTKWEFLLVCDNFIDYLSNNLLPIFTTETLVMYHQNPTDSKDYFEKKQNGNLIKKCKQGEHIPSSNEGYQLLWELTEAWDESTEKFHVEKYDNAKKKIIAWFGLNDKLNAALQFLHECLGGNCDKSILERVGFAFSIYCTIGKAKDLTVSELVEVFMENPSDIKALEALRDGVLEMADLK